MITFQQLKEALTQAPVLRYPVAGSLFILDTDASNASDIGAVLAQMQGGGENVIAYFRHALTKSL